MDTEKFKMGWLVVCFDLPVMTDVERKRATGFRNFLLKDGFLMMQYSVYVRSCVTFARQQTHIRRVEDHAPPDGSIRAFFITRAQWAKAYCIQGHPAKEHSPEGFPEQLLLW